MPEVTTSETSSSSSSSSSSPDPLSVRREMRKLAKTEEGRRRLKLAASEVDLRGNADLPFVHGLGHAERRRQHDGRVVTTIYPKMLYRKAKRPLPRVDWKVEEEEEEDGPNPFCPRRVGRMSLPSDFTAGLRSFTAECAAGTDYYFRNGMRMVRWGSEQ